MSCSDSESDIDVVKKDNKYGCYDDKFAIIIECKYDDIYIKDEYIECIYEGEELIYDTLEGKGYDFIIDNFFIIDFISFSIFIRVLSVLSGFGKICPA